jgi:hypothetical protein
MILRSYLGLAADARLNPYAAAVKEFWHSSGVKRSQIPDLLPEGINGPRRLCAQKRFQLGEGHRDRIEIRTVERQKQDPGPLRLDRFLGGLALGEAKLSMVTTSRLSQKTLMTDKKRKTTRFESRYFYALLLSGDRDLGRSKHRGWWSELKYR